MNPWRHHRRWASLFALCLAMAFAACGSDASSQDPDPTDPTDPLDPTEPEVPVTPDPQPGQDSFLSADSRPGQSAERGSDDMDAAPPEAGAPGDADERTVEEGDIYRVLGGKRILNLNAYRGLQIIDFSELTQPRIIGRFSIMGSPVELYTYDDRAIVLMNNWRGYYGSRFSTLLQEVSGGVVAIIDISQPEKPVLLSQAHVPGYIQRSRLVRGGGQAALYVAASTWGRITDPESGEETWGSRTYVKSFDVSSMAIEERSELEVGGYVTDIQATPEVLMVARGDHRWWSRGDGSTVMLIDISSPDGTMTQGDEVRVRGRVASQFNMDFHRGVLRVVSGNQWGTGRGNWVQTFDATDLSRLRPIHEATFGNPNEDLYATIFLGNKAFFVTYFRVDPFHAFEITDEGIATERTEFIVSGWNDFFRPVHNQTRLIGIGMNDEGGTNRAAVSLYDITDLDNPTPLMARAEVSTARWTWSEANWDHRAFSVLENAVDVRSPSGVRETGLVLLPFSGWDDNSYRSAVQVFTFSETTLTQRGVMEHPDPVRRTFLAQPETATNFSETEMRFHDVADPDNPRQLGAVELAPNYSDVWAFGNVAVRYRNPNTYWWYGRTGENPDGALEFFSARQDPDTALPLGSLAIANGSSVVRAGDGLVVMTVLNRDSGEEQRRVRVQTVDFSDPASPRLLSGAVVNLPAFWGGGGYYDYYYDDYYWGGYGGSSVEMPFAQDVLVHRQVIHEREELGREERCWLQRRSNMPHDECWDVGPDDEEGRSRTCTYHQGYRSCTTDHRGRRTCQGEMQACTYQLPQWELVECVPMSEEEIQRYFRERCDTNIAYRYWQRYVLHRIDLADPANPRMLAPLTTDQRHEMRDGAVYGGAYHLSWAEPVEVDGDPRSYVRWFFREVDLRAASEAEAFGPAVNVPGQLVQRSGDDLITRDLLYGERIVETSINRLALQGARAVLRGTQRFRDQSVRQIALDGAGLVLVSHQPWYRGHWDLPGRGDVVTSEDDEREDPDYATRLSIFRLASSGFAATASVPVDDWANLRLATPGRAIFAVGGGVLVMNLEDPSQPYPQTFVGLRGWPSRFVPVGRQLWMPSNRFGIQVVNPEEGNLLER